MITVSCTGLYLPGLDTVLIQELGLDAGVNRLPLSFLGCAAGMTGLRLAKELVQGNPSAKVLIVSVELCTLHIQPAGGRETLFASAFFGDGAAACVVGQPTGEEPDGILALGDHRTAIFPGSAGEMTWELGSHGFDLRLSPQIPKRIGEFVPGQIERLLAGEPLPELWAIHPGGRGIVDAMQTIYCLSDEQVGASRSVLRHFGNLSSATIFFVLEEMRRGLERSAAGGKEGLALAFGPGLNAEIMRLKYIPPMMSASGSLRREAHV